MSGVQKYSRYQAKSDSEQSRRRHDRDRRAQYLGQIPGEPTARQLQLIEDIIFLSWSAFVAEGEGGLVGLREAREHKRLCNKFIGDFETSITAAGDGRRPSLHGYMAAKYRDDDATQPPLRERVRLND